MSFKNLMVTRESTGSNRWNILAFTLLSDAAATGGLGSYSYVHDADCDVVWSTTSQPAGCGEGIQKEVFAAGCTTFTRSHAQGEPDVETQTDIALAPDDALELYRVTIHNLSDQPCRLSVTFYLEVVLGGAMADAMYPAFKKLFVERKQLPEPQCILFSRRPRDLGGATAWMFHVALPHPPDGTEISYVQKVRAMGDAPIGPE